MPYRLRKVNRKGEKFGAKAAARLKKPAACSIIILFIGKKGVREMKKRTISVLTAVIMLCCALVPVYSVRAAYPSSDDVMSVAEGIIEWKKRSMGLSGSDNLLSPEYVSAAGSPAGDWYPIGLGRLGIADDYARYLAAIRENISERYAKRGGLDAVKSTEWHRISLAVLALGGDPTSFGFDADGKPVNLIADGVYNRKTLGAQGINGLIWGLIALDAADASVPDGAYYTRDGDSCNSRNVSRRGVWISLRRAFRRAFEYYVRARTVDALSDVFLGTYRLSGGDSVSDTEKKQACARSVRCIFRRDIFASDGRFFGAVGRGDVLAFKIRSVCCRGSAGHGDICRFQRDIFACTVRVDGRKVGENNEKIRNMMLTCFVRQDIIKEK